MSSQTFQLAGQLEQAFNNIGSSMMSDDFACKLLAYLYVMGGGNEAVTMHEGLNAGIAIAQQKLNIKGGEVPHARFIPIFQKRVAELEKDMEQTEWLKEIYTRYDLKPSKGGMASGKQPFSTANK